MSSNESETRIWCFSSLCSLFKNINIYNICILITLYSKKMAAGRKCLNSEEFLDQLQGLSIEEDNELQEDEISDIKDSKEYIFSDPETSFSSSDNEEETSSIETKAKLSYFSGFSYQPSKGRSTARYITPSNSFQASTSRGEPLSLIVSSPFIIVNHLPQKAKVELPHLELFQSFTGFINSSSNINFKRKRKRSISSS